MKKLVALSVCVCILLTSFAVYAFSTDCNIAAESFVTYDFESENPFGNTDALVKPYEEFDNKVFSLASGSSGVLSFEKTVSEGILVLEADVYVDYDGTTNGMSVIRIDNGTGEQRIQLFTVSKSGNIVSVNGGFGSTVLDDEAWYRISLAINASAKTMTGTYARIDCPGESGEEEKMVFAVKDESGATQYRTTYPFDSKNLGTSTYPGQIKRLLINSARANFNDYYDNLTIGIYSPVYEAVNNANTVEEVETCIAQYSSAFGISVKPDESGKTDMQGVYEYLLDTEFSSDEEFIAQYEEAINMYSLIPGKTSGVSFDFEAENPFASGGKLVEGDEYGNKVFSLNDASSVLYTLETPVTDGVVVIETDVYVDYDGTMNGMSTLRIDNASSDERVQLFSVSRNGNAVAANGAFGATVFEDESWYRLHFEIDASTKTMTAKYSLIDAPGASGEWEAVIFTVKTADGSDSSEKYIFDDLNSGSKPFPEEIKRVMINSAREGFDDYFDNLSIETYTGEYFRTVEYTGAYSMSVSENRGSVMRLKAEIYDGDTLNTDEIMVWKIDGIGDDFTGEIDDVYISDGNLCTDKAVYGTVYVKGRAKSTPGLSTGSVAIVLEEGYITVESGIVIANGNPDEEFKATVYAPSEGNFVDRCLMTGEEICLEKTVVANSKGEAEFNLAKEDSISDAGMYYVVITNSSGKEDFCIYSKDVYELLNQPDASELLAYGRIIDYLDKYSEVSVSLIQKCSGLYSDFDQSLRDTVVALSDGKLENYFASVLLADVLCGNDENLELCVNELDNLGVESDGLSLFTEHKNRSDVAEAVLSDAQNIGYVAENIKNQSILIGVENSGEYYKNAKYYLDRLGNKKYDKADSSEKNQIARAVAGNKYDSVDELNEAIDDVKLSTGGSSGGSGGSGDSGKSSSAGGIIGYVPPAEIQQANVEEVKKPSFDDVALDYWCYDKIEKLASNGTVNGYGNYFYPENNITRAEFTKLLAVSFGIPEGSKSSFEDVEDTDWYFPYITGCFDAGLVMGDGRFFRPDESITRQDATVLIHRFAIESGISLDEGIAAFSDSDMIDGYAADAVGSLRKEGIINGMPDGSFAPQKNLTRAEAVKLIYEIMTKGGLL